METMSEQLDKEEAGLTTDRGLEGCIPGLQAFELFISSTFRKKYDKVKKTAQDVLRAIQKEEKKHFFFRFRSWMYGGLHGGSTCCIFPILLLLLLFSN